MHSSQADPSQPHPLQIHQLQIQLLQNASLHTTRAPMIRRGIDLLFGWHNEKNRWCSDLVAVLCMATVSFLAMGCSDDSAPLIDAATQDGNAQFDAGLQDGSSHADARNPPPQDGWVPPIGIPSPEFGIEEKAPNPPDPWTDPVPGFHYVDNTNQAATDDDNEYGTPSRPRLTIPTELQAGDVVEIHGGPYDSSFSFSGTGTASKPIFVRGASDQPRPILSAHLDITGSFFIFENLDLNGQDNGLSVRTPSDHVAVRFCEVRNGQGGPAAGLYTGRWNPEDDPAVATQIVFYGNSIHDNGDWHSDQDEDHHCVAVGHHADHVWIVDNEMYHCSGDGVQVNAKKAGLASTLNHVYIGRNQAWENKQTGFWSKQATDVIISQNTIWGMRPSNSSEGSGLGWQYGPERIWFIYNRVFDCENGIKSSTNVGDVDDVAGTGQDIYVIGNLFYDIHKSDGSGPTNDPWQYGSAIRMTDQDAVKHLVANTVYDVDVAITYARGTGGLVITDNLLAHVAGHHIIVETDEAAQASTTDHNLFGETASIRWGSSNEASLANFQSDQQGQCSGCIEANPKLADPTHDDFHLSADSPALDQGADASEYDEFKTCYGISIRVDLDGVARPQGSSFDIGAYER